MPVGPDRKVDLLPAIATTSYVAPASGEPEAVRAAFLGVEPEPGAEVSAIMIRITQAELTRLAIREKSYEARDLRADVRLIGDRRVGPNAAVWCFAGREGHRLRPSSDDAVVLAPYLERVVRGARLADSQIEPMLRGAAAASGFPIVDGSYRFVDERQAALV